MVASEIVILFVRVRTPLVTPNKFSMLLKYNKIFLKKVLTKTKVNATIDTY